eukprot:4932351-Pleurochrysis_carterae.AAC.2
MSPLRTPARLCVYLHASCAQIPIRVPPTPLPRARAPCPVLAGVQLGGQGGGQRRAPQRRRHRRCRREAPPGGRALLPPLQQVRPLRPPPASRRLMTRRLMTRLHTHPCAPTVSPLQPSIRISSSLHFSLVLASLPPRLEDDLVDLGERCCLFLFRWYTNAYAHAITWSLVLNREVDIHLTACLHGCWPCIGHMH